MAIDNEATFFAAGARRPELVNDGRTELKSKSNAHASKQAASEAASKRNKQDRFKFQEVCWILICVFGSCLH